jgi:hypothetical protein
LRNAPRQFRCRQLPNLAHPRIPYTRPTKARNNSANSSADTAAEFPITGIAGCCALTACLSAVALMIALFIHGEELPNPIAPPEAAIIGSALTPLPTDV